MYIKLLIKLLATSNQHVDIYFSVDDFTWFFGFSISIVRSKPQDPACVTMFVSQPPRAIFSTSATGTVLRETRFAKCEMTIVLSVGDRWGDQFQDL